MKTVEEINAEVDRATNQLGAYAQEIMDQVNATAGVGLTGEQTESLLEHLHCMRNQLTGMATDAVEMLPAVDCPPARIPGPYK